MSERTWAIADHRAGEHSRPEGQPMCPLCLEVLARRAGLRSREDDVRELQQIARRRRIHKVARAMFGERR